MGADYKVGDILQVEWTDACFGGTWETLRESRERPDEVDCKSVGYFLQETDELLWLNPDIGGTKEAYRTTRVIPKACIKEIHKL